MKKKFEKGFTLVEIIITMVIVSILSMASVSAYRGFVRKSMGTEASALLSAINNAEKIQLAQTGEYYTTSLTSFDEVLDVDARANKYFTSFSIIYDPAENLCYAVTKGNGQAAGISATLITDLKD